MLPIFSKLPCVRFLSQKWCLFDAHNEPRKAHFLEILSTWHLKNMPFHFPNRRVGYKTALTTSLVTFQFHLL